ncbi:MAG: DUF4249 domain-containing protein [Bacteroidales bacterium]|nr:DUF4249 domain-containing protein [Bacteroidales bacterium]
MRNRFCTSLFGMALLTVLFTGCENLIGFPDIPNHTPVPVIEAVLTNEPVVQRVKVSYSVSLSDTNSCRPLEDALVRVISNDGDTLEYFHQSKGWYHSAVFAAAPGIIYRLEVVIGGETYSSTGEVIEMNGIDSLHCRYDEESAFGDAGYYVYMNAGRVMDDTRYYIIDASRNDTLKTNGSEIWIFSDNLVESINNIKLPLSFTENDSVTIELYSISKTMYDYYYKLAYEVLNLNLSNISYRTNLPQLFHPAALGYFQVSAVSRKAIVIK